MVKNAWPVLVIMPLALCAEPTFGVYIAQSVMKAEASDLSNVNRIQAGMQRTNAEQILKCGPGKLFSSFGGASYRLEIVEYSISNRLGEKEGVLITYLNDIVKAKSRP